MTVDQRLRDELAAVAERVRPAPDPLGRLYARRRRNRRRASAVGAVAVAAVVAVSTLAFAGLGHDRPPEVADAQHEAANRLAWVHRLIDSPARGEVARNPRFVADLTQEVVAAHRAGRVEISSAMKQVKILFIGDTGPVRVALAAFMDDNGEPGRGQPSATWMLAPAGATAQALANSLDRTADPKNYVGASLDPFMVAELEVQVGGASGTVSIGVAPADCEVATAVMPDATDWRPEPTGSYVVRAPAQHRPEWWRVRCDGVVRFAGPAPFAAGAGNAGGFKVTDAHVDTAIANARGTVDRAYAREEIAGAARSWGYSISALPIVVWGGENVGPDDLDGRAILVAAPLVGGGWTCSFTVTYDPPRNGVSSGGWGFDTATDLGDPATVVAIPISTDTADHLFVVAPAGATAVRVLLAGHELHRAEVRNDAAFLPIRVDRPVAVEALDAAGAVVGRAELTGRFEQPREVNAWHRA
ncbi:MAG TPA: hypothetical protein VFR67_22035 [Pilimelia sp.]|nr:hypothetical protein [Pilimelia sp.]